MSQVLEQGRESSDRDIHMPYNLELHICTQKWKEIPSHQILSKKEEKEQLVLTACNGESSSFYLLL